MPQPSLAVKVRVRDLIHVPVVASLHVIVGVLQTSVADALPNAAVISDAIGLHPNGTVV